MTGSSDEITLSLKSLVVKLSHHVLVIYVTDKRADDVIMIAGPCNQINLIVLQLIPSWDITKN